MQHLAFIIDGNGRWAEARNLPRAKGHEEGAKAVLRAILTADELKIPCVSFYAFSTENFRRPQKEKEGIFSALTGFLDTVLLPLVKERGYRVRFIGNMTLLSEEVLSAVNRVNVAALNNRGMTVVIAVAYGGREELCSAVNEILKSRFYDCDSALISYEEIARYTYTANLPDPDAIVRFGGYKRLSNFMPLQSAYSELFFSDKLWPDVTREDILEIYNEYNHIKRNFGDIPK